jgi:hypothetical protein
MAKTEKTSKPKMIVREIPSKIKIIEPEAEEQKPEEKEEFREEASLEDLTTGAPSPRVFPTLLRENIPEQRQETEQVKEGDMSGNLGVIHTEEESKFGAKYEVQRNVTENEIRKVYNTRAMETRQLESRNPMLLGSERKITTLPRSPEVEATRAGTEEEDKRYEFAPETAEPTSKRKYPWEM